MDFKLLFDALEAKLAEENLTLDVHCVGGFVLQHHGLKATDDIDAFYDSSERIDALIAEVGEDFHVGTAREVWLNHSVDQVMAKPDFSDEETVYQSEHLTVHIVSLEAVLLNKVQVGRVKDISDIAKIMKKLAIEDPMPLINKLMRHSEGETDPTALLEAYAEAYGDAALENLIKNNQEIMRLLK